MKQDVKPTLNLSGSWLAALDNELQKPYIQELCSFLQHEREAGFEVYPPENQVLNVFEHLPFEDVKVLLIGQDPYHGPGQAHGFSFSVPKGVRLPPSLKNIFKELQDDIGLPMPEHGCLKSWVDQGVMLLNATLTVRRGEPLSHHNRGWELFTDAVVAALAARKEPLVFMLWGRSAREKATKFDLSQHLVLEAPHPSPFSARTGFFGCRHFSKANTQLTAWGRAPINWSLSN